MRAIVDTNVVVRHLTNRPPAEARRATRVLASASALIVSDVVFAECIHVLGSVYGGPPGVVADQMRSLLALPSATFTDRSLLERALELYERTAGLDYPDAHIAALAERDDASVLSFDRDFRRLPWIEWIEP